MRISDLSGETQNHVNGAAVGLGLPDAKGIALPAPYQVAALVGGQAWGVEVVAVQVGEGGAGDGGAGAVGQVDLGDGQVIEPDVVAGFALSPLGGVAHLAQHLAVGSVEVGERESVGALAGFLEHALAEGVVGVACDPIATLVDDVAEAPLVVVLVALAQGVTGVIACCIDFGFVQAIALEQAVAVGGIPQAMLKVRYPQACVGRGATGAVAVGVVGVGLA